MTNSLLSKSSLLLVAAAASLAACSSRPEVIQLEVPKPTTAPDAKGQMSVTGTATLEVAPDCADLTMTLTSEAQRPGAAATSVTGKEQALVTQLGKLGVEASDIKLSTVSLEPVYDYLPNLPARLRGYRAALTVTATTKQFGKIGGMMEVGADAGATSLSTQFRRSDLAELKKKVREMALAAARDKAKQTASALDIQLGRIVSVNENAGGMWNGGYFPQVANAVQREAAPGDTAVALGGASQTLTLDITVGYELAKS